MGAKNAADFRHHASAGTVIYGGVFAPFCLAVLLARPVPASPFPVTVEPASVRQGSYAVVMAVVAEDSGTVGVLDRTFPLYRVNGASASRNAGETPSLRGGLRALIPVPLATPPGRKEMVVRVSGRTVRLTLVVERRAGEKPQKLSSLTVDDKRAMAMKEDRGEMLAVLKKTGGTALWTGPLRVPIMGRISAVFGQKRVYGGGASWFHSGVDFAMPKGWPIMAAAPGRVAMAGMVSSYGNCVVLDHGQTVHTVYMHMSKLLVKAGERVNEGQIIGLVGDTGLALGPHLHFSAYITTVPVDPLEFLERGLP